MITKGNVPSTWCSSGALSLTSTSRILTVSCKPQLFLSVFYLSVWLRAERRGWGGGVGREPGYCVSVQPSYLTGGEVLITL